MQKNRRKLPYLTRLAQKLAPKVGARVVIEPEWGITAQIIYKNGITRSLRMYSLDLNHIASSDIARDKDFAKFFMKKKGYPVAEGRTFFEDNWAKIIKSRRTIFSGVKYAQKLGFPVIVKPNSKSQGTDVFLVWNKKELVFAFRKIFKGDKVAVIERYLPGRDYRIVVLDGEIISAYERIALSVIGNGKSSILALLKQKQKFFTVSRRDTKINFNDPRIKIKLKRQGHNLKSVLSKGKQVFLLDNANLSTGGEAADVSEFISDGFCKIAAKLTEDMGLRISGVDIMITEGDITQDPQNCAYYIIEINAAPGLDHYVTSGKKQQKIVETMYLKIFKALGKKD